MTHKPHAAAEIPPALSQEMLDEINALIDRKLAALPINTKNPTDTWPAEYKSLLAKSNPDPNGYHREQANYRNKILLDYGPIGATIHALYEAFLCLPGNHNYASGKLQEVELLLNHLRLQIDSQPST